MTPVASVGQDVHYVSHGTLNGEYPKCCRAAKVTEVDPRDPDLVGLCVLSPTGLFFHPLAADGCRYHDGFVTSDGVTSYPGGTWHWPERVGP